MAGCYDALMESHGKEAGEILPALEAALEWLGANPKAAREVDPPNGWGSYDAVLPIFRNLVAACREAPRARIELRPMSETNKTAPIERRRCASRSG